MTAALLVAGAAGLLVRHHRLGWSAGVAAAVLAPLLTIIGGAAWATLSLWRRLHARRLGAAAATTDVAVLTETIGLGLSAGLTLGQALRAARAYVHPELERELDGLLRRAAQGGLAQALADSEGYGRGLYVVMARAVVTGAPLVTAVDGFARELVAERHTNLLAAAHRLPVKLMVPLALLILPGFVLLTVGPAVLASLQRVVLPQ